ncbi:MAG: TIGR01777 family oxidoreductase [Planctomycetes bacterium]|nr:TIGR01777 family oxidoreductase [Planctomycetota bacterium]
MHVLVSGGTGFVGQRVIDHLLARNHAVTVISRAPASAEAVFGARVTACDYDSLPETFDAVVNLAGATLDKRWTTAQKQRILDSRVEITRKLISTAESRGATRFVSTSAVGYYGNRGDETLDEDSSPGTDFLSDVCVQWEKAAKSDKLAVGIIRLGIVLHHSGGALGVMLPLFRWFLGGRLGSGHQYWPWIHLDDAAALYVFMLEGRHEGVVSGTAPEPVTNREFTRKLAGAVHRPVSLPVPAFALRILYGEMADMLLNGQRAIPRRTLKLGFTFRHGDLPGALENALAD